MMVSLSNVLIYSFNTSILKQQDLVMGLLLMTVVLAKIVCRTIFLMLVSNVCTKCLPIFNGQTIFLEFTKITEIFSGFLLIVVILLFLCCTSV